MKHTGMETYRVRWDSLDGSERVVSACGYPREGAEERASLLRNVGYTNVEVYKSRPDSDEEVE